MTRGVASRHGGVGACIRLVAGATPLRMISPPLRMAQPVKQNNPSGDRSGGHCPENSPFGPDFEVKVAFSAAKMAKNHTNGDRIVPSGQRGASRLCGLGGLGGTQGLRGLRRFAQFRAVASSAAREPRSALSGGNGAAIAGEHFLHPVAQERCHRLRRSASRSCSGTWWTNTSCGDHDRRDTAFGGERGCPQ